MSGRRRSNISIPSFAPPLRGNDRAPGNPSAKANERRTPQTEIEIEMAETKDEVAGRIRIPVNERAMIRLESALQLHRHQQRQQQEREQDQEPQQQRAIPNKGHRISFRDFCAIASKIDIATADAAGDAAAAEAEETLGGEKGNDPIAPAANPTDSERFRKDLTEDSLGLWKLSREERLWHDLYCTAVPALYRAGDGGPNDNDAPDRGEPNRTSGNANENDKNKNKHKNKKRGRIIAAAARLTLTMTTTTTTSVRSSDGAGNGSRLTELRRLSREARTRGIPEARSDRALELLSTLKRETTRYGESAAKQTGGTAVSVANGSSSSSNNENASKPQQQQQQQQHKPSTADVLLRDPKVSTAASDKDNTNNENETTPNESESGPGKNRKRKTPSTIDDRIRARAQERERNLEQARAARKDPREERVAVADALYSYACHVLRRKRSRSSSSSLLRGSNRFATANRRASAAAATTAAGGATTIPSSRCSVSFREVVQQGLANRSRTDITRLFSDIRQVLASSSSSSTSSSSAPITFLRWKDPKTGRSNTVPIAKNATVWIDTADFKRVREVLNRERTSDPIAGAGVDERKKGSPPGIPVPRTADETKGSETPGEKARPS